MIKSINIKWSRTLLLLLSFAMLFFLTACGGSLDDDTGGGTSTGCSISITSTVTSLAAGESSIITATVTDGLGAPVRARPYHSPLLNNNSGATITALNGGHTDAKGQAIATYTAGTNSPTDKRPGYDPGQRIRSHGGGNNHQNIKLCRLDGTPHDLNC